MPGWRPGDPAGSRRFAELGTVTLESGDELPVTLAFETYGEPRRDQAGRITNAVLVLHALTGDAHVAGPAGPGQPTPGWWDPLVGPGRALDTERWFVLSANVLGGCQGSTGPWSSAPDGQPWGERFPAITIRDQVRAEAVLAGALDIDRFVAVLGGSMGGMRALEWACLYPDRVGAALVLAVGATATADQIGTQTTQVAAIRTDPEAGMGIARRIAHLTYRSGDELERRFGHQVQEDGRFAVASYLEHHAEKLDARFDPDSYVVLTEAMNSHDVGRDRGGAVSALRSVEVPLVVAGIDSDRLYPLALQRFIAATAPAAEPLQVIASPHGHDGFLLEHEAIGELVAATLARSTYGLARAR